MQEYHNLWTHFPLNLDKAVERRTGKFHTNPHNKVGSAPEGFTGRETSTGNMYSFQHTPGS
jgi:hypothetical protein